MRSRARWGFCSCCGDTVAYHTAPPQRQKAALEELEQQAALAAAERAEREKRETLLDIQNEKSMELEAGYPKVYRGKSRDRSADDTGLVKGTV